MFSLMTRGLTPSEIADEYQDTEFPARSRRFIAEKQRYFDATRKVLGESIKAEQDPLVVEARKKHFEELCGLIESLEESISWLTNVGIYKGVDWSSDGLQIADLDYPPEGHPHIVIEIKSGRITEVSLHHVEGDPLFGGLLKHLGNEFSEMYYEWKELFRQRLQRYLRQKRGLPVGTRARRVNLYVSLTQALTEALTMARLRRVFPGKCEACP